MDFNPIKIKAKEFLLEKFRKQGKSLPAKDPRLPPGQHLVTNFPVLDLGAQPEMKIREWKLKISGVVKKPVEVSLEEIKKLGVREYTADFHCVTGWSKFDVRWRGIPFRKIIELARPDPSWKHLIQYGKDNYSTNVPREDIDRDDVCLVFELDGKPIPREHGYVRLIIPHLYAWKTSKFLTGLEFSKEDKPGFWEVRGYHNHGDALKEERYS